VILGIRAEVIRDHGLCRENGRPGEIDRNSAYDGGVDDIWMAVGWAILPTLAVSAVFVIVLRGILRFDRTERKVHARIEAEERAARGLPPKAS